MIKRIKLHLQKYIFYDITAILLFILLNYIAITFYNDYQINKESEYDYSNYNSFLIDAYNINPSLFNFNKNGIAIVEISDLLESITNGKDTIYFGEIPMTKNQDECVGYIIITRKNNNFKFDYSHICDMLDY